MLVADSQVHVWTHSTRERPWRPNHEAHRRDPFGADELLREMQSAGVDRAILIPPYWDGDPADPVMETRHDYVLEAACRHPTRFAVMGRIKTGSPAAHDLIASWRRQPGMLGLRCSFTQEHQIATLEDGSSDRLWSEAERSGVPVMVMVSHERVALIDRVAERHPDLKLILSHLALTNNEVDAVAFRGLDKLLAIARRDNVAVKVSALPAYTRDDYPYRRLHPYLRRVFDAFGPLRMFWGSDLVRLPCTYRQAVTMFTEEIPWLSEADKEWIMGRGLCEWLDWTTPGQP